MSTSSTGSNILILMVDHLNGTLFPDGPADWLHTPNLDRLAARSTRFAHTYTASPLCAPARASFMTGQLPSRTCVYDNAAEFASSIPTYAHHLRRAGYYTALSGKMHFVGHDQLHCFEDRLTTDIYPADFGWTPDYRKPGERIDWWYHNMGSVTGSGVADITNQMEYDDAVAFEAEQKLYDLSRGKNDRPWCLTVSFTHPHAPYVARREFWDLYNDCNYLMPRVGAIPYEEQDAHSQRILDANDLENFDITDADIAWSRQAYFANISYLDTKIMEPGLITVPVSTIDLCPTLCDLAGVSMEEVLPWTDGESLTPLGNGGTRSSPVAMEYADEGSYSPLIGLVQGDWHYTNCAIDPEQPFNRTEDPDGTNHALDATACEDVLERFCVMAAERWDLEAFDAHVRESQARRWVVYEALRSGCYYPWGFQPLRDASERYMRNHMDLNVLEENQCFPRGE